MTTTACPDAGILAAYLDGTLPADDRPAVEQHLVACVDCRDLASEVVLALTAAQKEKGSQ